MVARLINLDYISMSLFEFNAVCYGVSYGMCGVSFDEEVLDLGRKED